MKTITFYFQGDPLSSESPKKYGFAFKPQIGTWAIKVAENRIYEVLPKWPFEVVRADTGEVFNSPDS